jgi:hypothetical protein
MSVQNQPQFTRFGSRRPCHHVARSPFRPRPVHFIFRLTFVHLEVTFAATLLKTYNLVICVFFSTLLFHLSLTLADGSTSLTFNQD